MDLTAETPPDENERVGQNIIVARRAEEPFLKNGYLVAYPDSQEVIYIDPGDEAPQMIQYLDEQTLTLTAIVNTHAHLDHISGIGRVKEKWDVPIYLHPEDQFLYDRLTEQAQWFGLTCDPAPPVTDALLEDQDLELGQLRFRVHLTPGHSPGSVSLEIGEDVFSGDVIFAGSIGRTDLPGGSLEILMDTIQERILPLGDDKILHPGHGPDTTVGQERLHNPFLTGHA